MTFLITGGAGFIGSAVIRYILANTNDTVVNVDKLTYASQPDVHANLDANTRYAFEHVDICDRNALNRVLHTHQPDAVMHLAAESHVDRSIHDADTCIHTNIVGTYTLLEAVRHHWDQLSPIRQQQFRFHHVSTDEVYGDHTPQEASPAQSSTYAPSSPYSASKASADHLVQAWRRTYGLPTLISHSSNAYGPGQHAEKLIPRTIRNALSGKPIPVYGDGRQRRNWLYVDDLARALYLVITRATSGTTYDIGTHDEHQNIDVIRRICEHLDMFQPDSPHIPHASLITHVADRPGHDRSYAACSQKIREELGWMPIHTFSSGLIKTIDKTAQSID